MSFLNREGDDNTVKRVVNQFPFDYEAAKAALIEEHGDAVEVRDGYLMAPCLCHEDPRASMSVKRGDKRPVVVKCFADCDQNELYAALVQLVTGSEQPSRNGGPPVDREDVDYAEYKLQQELLGYLRAEDKVTQVFVYRDADGNVLREKYRYPDGGKRWDTEYIGRSVKVPYKLPELRAAIAAGAERAFVVDGERDVEALRTFGFVATCAPGNMGSWDDEYSEQMRGLKRVIVVQDRDDGRGAQQAQSAKHSLLKVVPEVVIVEAVEGKDARDHLLAGHLVSDFVTVEETRGTPSDPSSVLSDSRVDLVGLIRTGLPERAYVPGCDPWLIRGARYLVPAPAGAGKSLCALIVGVDVVAAGGSVMILDVENGEEEYARRLADVLSVRDDDDGKLADACQERFSYHAWPALKTSWAADDWVGSCAAADLVIFDSSRLMLSAAGLDEDRSNDYAEFVNGLLIPLARAKIATMVLDNTGHEHQDRARGSSSKPDLNEVVYVAKVKAEFDRDRLGELRLERTRTRFADIPKELRVNLGGGTYGPVSVISQAEHAAEEARTIEAHAERCRLATSIAIQKTPGIKKTDLRKAVKGFSTTDIEEAIAQLVTDGRVRLDRGLKNAVLHYPIKRAER